MKHSLIRLSIILFTSIIYAQHPEWNTQVLKMIPKASQIIQWEQFGDYSSFWFVKVQVKKRVGLYCVRVDTDTNNAQDSLSIEQIIKPKYHSIKALTLSKAKFNNEQSLKRLRVYLVKRKNQSGLVVLEPKNLSNAAFFSEEDPETLEYRPIKLKHVFTAVAWNKQTSIYVPVLKRNKWGLYDWYHQKYIVKPSFEQLGDVPPDESTYKFAEWWKKNTGFDPIDLTENDTNNGDNVFKARNAKTKKWGIFQGSVEITELIPMAYDSIANFRFNAAFTEVFNDGKAGIYLAKWSYDDRAKQTVDCIYDKFKRYKDQDGNTKLAAKRDEKWGWVDWLTGEEKSEFKYATSKDLPYPYYKQALYFDE